MAYRWLLLSLFCTISTANAQEYDPEAAERGRKALESTAFIKAFWPRSAYDNVWKVWGNEPKPLNFPQAFRERYGLHPAPYPNDNYPMGLRKADQIVGTGVGIDCMTCHGGSIFGKSYVGLGNSSLDIHALFEEMAAASSNPVRLPFQFAQARGVNEAGAFSVYLLGMRNPDLSLRKRQDLGLRDDSCEVVPAWWLLKKKKSMYFTGAADARSVRSIMQFMMHPLTTPGDFEKAEPAFRDVLQYILSLEPPKYPLEIDQEKAEVGRELFTQNCAKCHGTYGENWTYPNKIVPLDEIGTDPKRFENIGLPFGEAYNKSWFAKEDGEAWFAPGTPGKPVRETDGYQAPPLDGIWATAPYFHNGSVPTVYGVLNSKARPKVFTRSFQTAQEDYDSRQLGWKIQEVSPPALNLPAIERRKVYDTTQPGRSNTGHTFGDHLTDEERFAIIEYLKTL